MPASSGPSSIGSTSSGLIERAQARDAAAWEQLVQLYAPLVYHWCRRSEVPPADAADVVQEVFLAVARGLDRFDRAGPEGSFRGWLRVITRSKVVDYVRRQADRPEARGGSTARIWIESLAEPGEEDDASAGGVGARQARLQQALEQLRGEVEERSWQAFWQTTIEGHAPAEVAARLGMRIGTVYQARSRLLARLRQIAAGGTP